MVFIQMWEFPEQTREGHTSHVALWGLHEDILPTGQVPGYPVTLGTLPEEAEAERSSSFWLSLA